MPLLESLFGLATRLRKRTSKRVRRRVRTRRHLESLESRLAMAVDVIFQPDVPGRENWVTVLASEGDSVFVQEVSNSENDLFIANNSSFFPGGDFPRVEVENFSSRFDTLAVRSGKIFSSQVTVFPTNFEKSNDTVSYILESVLYTISDLDSSNVGAISGTFLLGTDTISFNNAAQANSGLVVDYSGSVGGTPVTGTLGVTFFSAAGYLGVEFTSDPALFLGFDVPRLTSLSVDDNTTDDEVRWSNLLGTGPTASLMPTDGEAGNPSYFQIPDLAANTGNQYVPGTLSGTVVLAALGNAEYGFQIENADYGQEFSSQALGVSVPISFGQSRDAELVIDHNAISDQGNFLAGSRQYVVTGTLNTATGVITFRTQLQTGGSRVAIQLPIYLASHRFGGRSYEDKVPTNFTLFDGHTFTNGLIAEMVNPRSSISIESPIVTTGGINGLGKISLAATEVIVKAPVRAARSFTVPAARDTAGRWDELWDHDGDGSDEALTDENGNALTDNVARDSGTVTERLSFMAAVSSSTFELQIEDEDDVLITGAYTGTWGRSQFLVSQTGSMSDAPDVLNVQAGPLPPADEVFVEVDNGDIFLEGQVVADRQSYFLRSPKGSELTAPFRLTTESRLTGGRIGMVIGDTVAVTLANDGFGEMYDSYIKSVVSLDTDIDRLRVQAAFRGPYSGSPSLADPLEAPFAYDLSVREQNGLIVDSVASSTGTLKFDVTGGLDLLAAIETSAGDVVVESSDSFTVQAPIQVAFGSIAITAPTINVQNSLRVVRALQDNVLPDISLIATAGPILLDDAVHGLKEIVIDSRGQASSITGTGRVAGDTVDLRSGGEIVLGTEAGLVKARTFGRVVIDDIAAAAFEVRESSDVTLSAAGYDVVDPDPWGPGVSPALIANLYDTKVLTVSAPNGSVDVRHYGDASPVLGHLQRLRAGTADPMVAAGSVSIVSDIGSSVTVYDAPYATGNAVPVKVVTTAALPNAIFQKPEVDEEGIRVAVILTSMNVSPSPGRGLLSQFDNIEAEELVPGDRVLVKDGISINGIVDMAANGIYVVASRTYDTAGKVTVALVRDSRYDTTAELARRVFVRAVDGSHAGKLFVGNGFDFNKKSGAYPLAASEGRPRDGHVSVLATAVTSRLEAKFSPGAIDVFGDTITSLSAGSIRNDDNRLLFDDVQLGKDDLVLIRIPVAEYNDSGLLTGEVEPRSVGIYQVIEEGESADENRGPGKNWKLQRWRGVNEDGFFYDAFLDPTPDSGTLDPVFEGVVAVNDGSLRTARTGLMYDLRYRLVNRAPIEFLEVSAAGETGIPEGAESEIPWQSIRTRNPNGTLDFVVSTESGMNEGSGSFGRMLNLAQANNEYLGSNAVNVENESRIYFDTTVRRVELTQALPAVVDPLVINPSSRVVLDGTEVELTRNGQRHRSGMSQYFIGPVRPSEVATARRLVRSSRTDPSVVHGLELYADHVEVGNFLIGGFESGAGIYVAGASNALINNVIIGREDDGGSRLPNGFGVEVIGANNNTAEYTTILNTVVVASEEVGVKFSEGAAGVRVVGSTIGAPNASNQVGVLVDTMEMRENFIGAYTVPSGALVAKGAEYRSRVLVVRAASNAPGRLEELSKNLFIGQSVFMGVTGGLPGDARIQSLNMSGGDLIIGLTREVLRAISGDVPLSFGTPARNSVGGNQDNIVVKSGSVRIVNTDVHTAIFDGIRIEGNGVIGSAGPGETREGKVVIGGGIDGLKKELDQENVAIHSNQAAGVRISEEFIKHIDPDKNLKIRDKYEHIKRYVLIAGNYIGTDRSGSNQLGNGYYGLSDFAVGGTRQIGVRPVEQPHPLVEDRLLVNPEPGTSDRDSTGRYRALYRPEDFAAFGDVGFDREGNYHGGGDLSGIDPPPLDPDPPVYW